MFKDHENSIGVRIGVKSGGCAGMSYVMEYAKEINPTDEIIEDKGVKVFIDPSAIMYLLGTEMDYKKEQFSSTLSFWVPYTLVDDSAINAAPEPKQASATFNVD